MLCGISSICIYKTMMYNNNRNSKITIEKLYKLNEYKNESRSNSKSGSNSAYANKSFEEVLKEKIMKINGR